MIHLIGEHWEGDVRVRWYGDDATNLVTVERWQDPQKALDMVAAVNAEGAPTNDGIGRAFVEIPEVLATEYCRQRGIDVGKFLYSPEHADEIRRFAAEHSKLAYKSAKRVHTVQ